MRKHEPEEISIGLILTLRVVSGISHHAMQELEINASGDGEVLPSLIPD
jgi:hypothetical protein